MIFNFQIGQGVGAASKKKRLPEIQAVAKIQSLRAVPAQKPKF